jgi:hypothetical protein
MHPCVDVQRRHLAVPRSDASLRRDPAQCQHATVHRFGWWCLVPEWSIIGEVSVRYRVLCVGIWALVGGALLSAESATARATTESWGQPLQLSPTGHLAQATVEGDNALVAWTADHTVVVAYHPVGGQWENTELGEGSRPRVAVNADGAAVVAWQRSSAGGSAIEVAVHPAAGGWSQPTTLTGAGRFPTVTVNAAGTFRVLALRWGAPVPARTDVKLFTFTGSWSTGKVLNERRLENNPALRRSLTLTTNSAGSAVVGWLCRGGDLPPGDPRAEGWICLHYPRSRNEATLPARAGRYAVSAPVERPIFLATPNAVSEARPGSLLMDFWGWGSKEVSQVSLDVARHGRGMVAWQFKGTDDRLRVATRRAGRWGRAISVARNTHGISGATFAEPDTAIAFWRTAAGTLTTAAKAGRSSWQRAPGSLGRAVEQAQLVSDHSGNALIAWSSSATGTSGVYVSTRPSA